MKGADWRHPGGPGSSLEAKQNHPVVNVAYEDALAYAHWLGRELPTEAQWEFAARGGHNTDEDWSEAFDKDGKPIANSWQGIFPVYNTEEDGYARHGAGRLFQAQRLRSLRHDRQCLGVDQRLVRAGPSERACHQSKRAKFAASEGSGGTIAEQGHKGRLISLRI